MATDTLSFENCENLNLDCKGANPLLLLEEQKEIVLQMLFDGKTAPYYGFISQWNAHNPFLSAPDDVQVASGENIENAFVVIVAADPGIEDNNKHYSDSKGNAIVEYGYNLTKPEDSILGFGSTCNLDPPVNEYEDCATHFVQINDKTQLAVFQNGKLIGVNKQLNYVLNETSRFEAKLNIVNEIMTKHSKWAKTGCCEYKYCCIGSGQSKKCGKFEQCGCEVPELSCIEASTEPITKTLGIADEYIVYPQPALGSQDNRVFISSSSREIKAVVTIDTSNAQSYSISTKTQTFKKVLKNYIVKFKHMPFDALYVETGKEEEPYVKNMNIQSIQTEGIKQKVTFGTTMEDLEECQFTVYGFFNETATNCEIITRPMAKITLQTDQWIYNTNESVILDVGVGDIFSGKKTVIITYGNSTIGAETEENNVQMSLKPQPGQSFILVRTVDESENEAEASINVLVYDKSSTNMVTQAATLFVASFLMLLFFKRLWKKNS